MSRENSRRHLIVQTAGRLFMEQGYLATSVRQIAEVVGCTEAALYYHFPKGKQELLKTVIEECLPDLTDILNECQEATSLADFLLLFGRSAAKDKAKRGARLRWVISDFPRLSTEERALLHQRQRVLHDRLALLLQSFLPDKREAHELAWTLLCIVFGYGLLFWSLDLQSSVVDFSEEDLTRLVIQRFTTSA